MEHSPMGWNLSRNEEGAWVGRAGPAGVRESSVTVTGANDSK